MSPEELRYNCFLSAMTLTKSPNINDIINTAQMIYNFVSGNPQTSSPQVTKSKKKEAVSPKSEPIPLDDVMVSAETIQEHNEIVSELVAELKPNDRIVMKGLLKGIETKYLKKAYEQYLPRVLSNS